MSRSPLTTTDRAYFDRHTAILLPAQVASLLGRYVGVSLLVVGVLAWQRPLATAGLLLVTIRLWMTILAGLMLFPGWMIELDKLLVTAQPSVGLDFLARTRLLNFMLPELSLQVGYDQNSPYHELTLWEHTQKVVDLLPADATLRWAGLLHDIGKPFVRTEKADRSNYIKHDLLGAELVNRIGLQLKWSNDRRETVRELILNHMQASSPLREADTAAHS